MANRWLASASSETPISVPIDERPWYDALRRNLWSLAVPVIMALDWLLINLIFHGTYAARFEWGLLAPEPYPPPWKPYFYATLFIATIWVGMLAWVKLYHPKRPVSYVEDLFLLGAGLGAGALITMALAFFYRDFSYSRLVLVYSLGFSFAILGTVHVLMRALQLALRKRGWGCMNTLIVGCNTLAEQMATRLIKAPELGHRLLGMIPAPGERLEGGRWLSPAATDELREASMPASLRVLGNADDLPAIIARYGVDEVIFAKPGARTTEFFELMGLCGAAPVHFRIVPDLFELVTAQIHLGQIDGIPTMEIQDIPLRKWHNRFLKRGMDIFLSALGLFVASPVMVAAAVAVRLSSPGPVFYRQERMGRDGRLFSIYKFRSMRLDAEADSGPVWARQGDPRTTWVGAFLRRFSLDELPQLYNVLIGDMSLVGPRPERPYFVSQFRQHVPKYMDRHLVRSGLTGWAQINGLRGEEGSIEDRTRFDIYYVENWSLLFDVRILFKTVAAVILHKAY